MHGLNVRDVNMDEIWKDVIGYEGLYQVSNLGRVRSIYRYKKVLTPICISGGYNQVQLCKKGKVKAMLLHRFVASVFLENRNKPCVNRKDGDKSNNSIDNLEWCTYSENEKHSYHVLHKKANKNRLGLYGAQCCNHKDVIQLSLNGSTINEFESISEASRKTGIIRGNIWDVMNGRRNHAGGFKWKYKTFNGLK